MALKGVSRSRRVLHDGRDRLSLQASSRCWTPRDRKDVCTDTDSDDTTSVGDSGVASLASFPSAVDCSSPTNGVPPAAAFACDAADDPVRAPSATLLFFFSFSLNFTRFLRSVRPTVLSNGTAASPLQRAAEETNKKWRRRRVKEVDRF